MAFATRSKLGFGLLAVALLAALAGAYWLWTGQNSASRTAAPGADELEALIDAGQSPARAIAAALDQRDSGDLSAAAATLERALIVNPDAQGVRAYYAALLCQLDDQQAAGLEVRRLAGEGFYKAGAPDSAATCAMPPPGVENGSKAPATGWHAGSFSAQADYGAGVVGLNAAIVPAAFFRATGTASEVPAKLKGRVRLGDGITTGEDGLLQILLLDKTSFTVGKLGSVTIDRFVYDPDTSASEVAVSVLKGAFRFISGKATKARPGRSSVGTPVGSIGIRGTMFEGAVGDEATAIARIEHLDPKAIALADQNATLVVLLGPGQGAPEREPAGAVDLHLSGAVYPLEMPGYAYFVPFVGAQPIGPFKISDPGLVYLHDLLSNRGGQPLPEAALAPPDNPASPSPSAAPQAGPVKSRNPSGPAPSALNATSASAPGPINTAATPAATPSPTPIYHPPSYYWPARKTRPNYGPAPGPGPSFGPPTGSTVGPSGIPQFGSVPLPTSRPRPTATQNQQSDPAGQPAPNAQPAPKQTQQSNPNAQPSTGMSGKP